MFSTLKAQLDTFLWQTRVRDVGPLYGFAIRTARIIYAVIRDISGGLPSLRAMSLVYTTLISLVPLLAVSFSVLKGFGVHNQLEPALVNLLEPLGEKGLQLSQQIIEFVDQVKVGVLGSIGLLVLVFTVLSLVKKIESAFNYTWRITITRSLSQRFSSYLSVILIGPLLLFTATGLKASFNSSSIINSILSIEPFGTIILFVANAMPFILTIASFTLMYILIPNTRVKFKSALVGAFTTAICWKVTGTIFAAFIVDSTNYTAIYSGFAILIIFMIWIYINWLVILAGASVSYYHQHPDRISNKSQIIRLSCRLREKLALTIMQMIGHSFHHNEKPWTVRKLAKKTTISEPALQLVISALVEHKLLTACGRETPNYIPGQSLENISLAMILDAARSAEEHPSLRPEDVETVDQVNETISQLNTAINDSVNNRSLRDLI
jgi:membrane protein